MPALAAAVVVAVLAGQTVISEADVADYQATQACYGEGALTSRQAAFMRLLEAAIAEEAMAGHGGKRLSEADLKTDAARIDKETRAPDILACIKAHFGADEARYRRIFVRPRLAESRLRDFLAKAEAVQGQPRRQAKEAAAKAAKGMPLEQAALSSGLVYSSATYSLEASTRPSPGRSGFEEGFINARLRGLTTGQLSAEPMESDYDLSLVRLLAVDGPRFTFELASVRKRSQEQWFSSLPKMSLRIDDAALKAWIASIKGNPRLGVVALTP